MRVVPWLRSNGAGRDKPGPYEVSAATTASTHSSALARISSSVASWMGCATNTRRASFMPRASAWAVAASTNSEEAMLTEGTPWISNHTVSCKLHVVQEPQSASASITKSLASRMSRRSASGAGFVNVGFA